MMHTSTTAQPVPVVRMHQRGFDRPADLGTGQLVAQVRAAVTVVDAVCTLAIVDGQIFTARSYLDITCRREGKQKEITNQLMS